MRKSLGLWQIAGFACTAFLGTLLHFLFEWCKRTPAVGLVASVNESTWEHMKLLFVPMFLFALVERFGFRDCKRYWCVKTIGSLTGILAIPILFYTIQGAFGDSPDWLNIVIFFLSAALAYWLEYCLFRNCRPGCCHPKAAFAVLLLLAFLFCLWTFYPPQIPLFRDPVTGVYGIGE